jgi:hypothetical protein
MSDFSSNSTQVSPQIIERPTSVTVFGILNIVFGLLGLICAPMVDHKPTSTKEMVWNLIAAGISIGFAIWILVLGYGLLKLKPWARRGLIGYACVYIVYMVVISGTDIIAILHRLGQPDNEIQTLIVTISVGLIGLIYPILLLIFMQTAKVKQAFAAIER